MISLSILLATANPHKVAELRDIFAAAGAARAAAAAEAGDPASTASAVGGAGRETRQHIRVESLADIPGGRDLPEPDEHGTTFLQNATIKAVAYARATRRLCLSDDSGLAVDALAGAPGVNSSHFASPPATPGITPDPAAAFAALRRDHRDALNNAKLLAALERVAPEARSARFVCVMVLAAPDGTVLHSSRGEFPGRIGVPPRVPAGTNGFGYDPLFLVGPDFTRTGAELDSSEKNRLSHRARAATAMAQWLTENRSRLHALTA